MHMRTRRKGTSSQDGFLSFLPCVLAVNKAYKMLLDEDQLKYCQSVVDEAKGMTQLKVSPPPDAPLIQVRRVIVLCPWVSCSSRTSAS